MNGAYDNERWGPPSKSNRYDRISNKKQFDKNFEESNLGRDVSPTKSRRIHIVYKTNETVEREEANRRYKEGLAILQSNKENNTK